MKNKIKVVVIVGVIAIAIMIMLLICWEGDKKEKALTVGFIMSGSVNDEGWNGMHYDGVKKACKELKTKLIVKENVEEF